MGARRGDLTGARRARRGRDLPLPLLFALAIGAVIADRLGKRGLLVAIPGLLLCLVLAAVVPQVANRATKSITAGVGTAVSEQAPPAETGNPRGAQPEAPAAAENPRPAEEQPANSAVPTGVGGQPSEMAANAVPVTPTLAPVIAPTTGVAPAIKNQPRGTTVIPILMYHYVRVVTDPQDAVGIGLSVTPTLFAAQMQYLADKGYTTLTMQEVHAILNGEKTLPAKPIALTFDDGYRDFYTNAWPVLQKHGFKSTNYVVTDFIGWDSYMTWAMLQELDATNLVEIGAHTRSHSDLRALSAEKRWDEIIGSKAILEQGLGHPVRAFCYPAGFYNAAVIADVKRANFLTATTVEAGTKQNSQSALQMPRIRVNGPDSVATWASKLP